jgi:hypothetical protein
MPLTSDLQNRIDKAGGNIKVFSKPIIEQVPVILHEEWTIHFISGNSFFDYAAHRNFKTSVEHKFGKTVEIFPVLVDNITAAHDLVRDIISALPPGAGNNFKVFEVRDRDFQDDEPVYVEIVIRKIYGFKG